MTMYKAYTHAMTALAHSNRAIDEARKCGLGYPTNTYVDLLYDAAQALDRFVNQHKTNTPPSVGHKAP